MIPQSMNYNSSACGLWDWLLEQIHWAGRWDKYLFSSPFYLSQQKRLLVSNSATTSSEQDINRTNIYARHMVYPHWQETSLIAVTVAHTATYIYHILGGHCAAMNKCNCIVFRGAIILEMARNPNFSSGKIFKFLEFFFLLNRDEKP